MQIKTLDEFEFQSQRVLMRVDINVPLAGGTVTDISRIKAILPSIRHICARGGRVILLAHLGRPKGQIVPAMSLSLIQVALADALGQNVGFSPHNHAQDIAQMRDGDVMLLENIRFCPGEEKNDIGFAQKLAALGDIYINDAFSVSHRAHASVDALARLLPSGAGRNMHTELGALESALTHPERPLVALVGGAKISTKIGLLSHLLTRCDHLIVGGVMANTFLAAQGRPVGGSLIELDLVALASEIIENATRAGCALHLPVDIVVAKVLEPGQESQIVAADACPQDKMILDIGPQSIAALNRVLAASKTLIWNGPLGAFEIPPFERGTNSVAKTAARLVLSGALSAIAGGGDTLSALNGAGVREDFSYVSTAGGAFLEWMEGKTLPGIAALKGI